MGMVMNKFFLLCYVHTLSDYGLFAGGGEMIVDVFLDHSTYASPPSR